MSRYVTPKGVAAAVLALAIAGAPLSPVFAFGPDDYTLSRTFELPAALPGSGGTVLFDALPDGRLLLLNGSVVSVETAAGSGSFVELGAIPGFNPTFGPAFVAVSPDGTRAAAGSNGLGSVVVFSTTDPSVRSVYIVQDYDAVWLDATRLLIANATTTTGVQLLDTASGAVTPVIVNVGGASAGIALDRHGNLYTGNSYDFVPGGSGTGWVKAFPAGQWQAALTGGAPLDFETTGIPVADLLSAASLGFDAFGNFFVGGADFFGGSGDFGYAALVSADAVAAALASPQAEPPITAASAAGVLRKFASPQATIDNFQPPAWRYNTATGEIYLRYAQQSTVQVWVIPEPTVLPLLLLPGVVLLGRRRRPGRAGQLAAAAVSVGVLGAATASASYVYDPLDFAVEVVASTGLPATGLYNDPAAVLGRPTLRFNAGSATSPDVRRAKLIEAPFNRGIGGETLITTFNNGQSVTVRMGRPVEDHPLNPFGIDFIVFGNAFFTGSGGTVSDATDLNTFILSGSAFVERTLVSVSPDGVQWYTYTGGPYGDQLFPTNAYRWDRATASWSDDELDPTRPVNPALLSQSLAGRTAADVLELYDGSAGGTGFDLAPSGFTSIRYIRFEGAPGFVGGEIDAVARVRPIPEPAAAGVVLSAVPLLARRRRV
ncbi:MAG: hypothetical protein ACK4PI_13790 [Tepidisphaerales bacterium]